VETQTARSPVTTNQTVTANRDTADAWKEVDSSDKKLMAVNASLPSFDMDLQMNADFIFKGKVLSHKNYEISYTDKDGIQWGPNPASLLQVQILEKYIGESPVKKGTITIYFPFSTDIPLDGSFIIDDGQEYVFFARLFGEKHLAVDLIDTPYYKDEMEKRADMYISDNNYSLLPIENGKVVANVEYDFEKRAISLDTHSDKKELAPKAFELFEEGPSSVYSLLSEKNFARALQHFSK
jgi:hypothetical protein